MAENLINSLLSLAPKLISSITASAHAPPSSSNSNNSEAVEKDLERLMRTLERIKATLYDAGEREMTEKRLWIKELNEELNRFKRIRVEARKSSEELNRFKGIRVEARKSSEELNRLKGIRVEARKSSEELNRLKGIRVEARKSSEELNRLKGIRVEARKSSEELNRLKGIRVEARKSSEELNRLKGIRVEARKSSEELNRLKGIRVEARKSSEELNRLKGIPVEARKSSEEFNRLKGIRVEARKSSEELNRQCIPVEARKSSEELNRLKGIPVEARKSSEEFNRLKGIRVEARKSSEELNRQCIPVEARKSSEELNRLKGIPVEARKSSEVFNRLKGIRVEARKSYEELNRQCIPVEARKSSEELNRLKGIPVEARKSSEELNRLKRIRVEARKSSEASSSHQIKLLEYIAPIPDVMVDRLNKIRSRFDEIAKDREALLLRESDGVRCFNNKILQPPTGHMVDKTKFFGRDADITEVINYLLSEKKKSFSVISIAGKDGLGKTTIAQLVYKDGRVTRCFDLFGWVCVYEEFDVRRLIKSTIESVSKTNCGVSELSLLQEELAKTVKGKTVLLVLDDVRNENQSLWELFQAPFKEAKKVRILVTTRSKKVADVMLTTTLFRPNNLPESSCWQLFQHYAFSDTSDTVPTHLVDMGREIMRKCGGLPLEVKLIASLLRHENEESWREILYSDIWDSMYDIFPAIQISYAHLPAHLKPCFLFCSLYPKNYILEKMKLIELWISHGYIESKGTRTITEIGVEYYEELKERSFLDDFSSQSSEFCKLHNIIHDLARLKSENEHYSVEINQPLDIQMGNVPREVYHLYARGFLGYVNQMLQQNQRNLMGLRTLFMDLRGCGSELEHQYCIKNNEAVDLNLKQSENYEECYGGVAVCNLNFFEGLTVLELKGYNLTKIPDSISQLKHLAYLCITSSRLKMLPLSVGLLYNLQTLILDCFSLEYLPESIGDLANLQFLYIQSGRVKKLPKSLCSLSNLLRLVIRSDNLEEVPLDLKNLSNLYALTIRSNQIQALPNTIGCLNSLEELNLLSLGGSYDDLPDGKLDYVPHGFVNFPAIKTMAAWLGVRTINWLKGMKELEGKLSIGGLKNIINLEDAQHANMRNKCKLETLDLCWDPGYYMSPYDVKSELRLSIIPEACEGGLVGADDAVSFSLLEYLQPHPNLKKLLVRWYPSATVPNWMKDPSSFRSIQEVLLECCVNIQSLPFNNFHTLKHLTIVACSRIRVLQLEQLSSQLAKLQIVSCDSLELITGLGDLDMLAALEIYSCQSLKSLTMEELQLVKSTEPFDDSFKKSHVGLLDMFLDMLDTLELQLVKYTEPFDDSSHEKSNIGWQKVSSLRKLEIKNCYSLPFLPDGLIPPGPCYVCVRGCGFPDLERNLTSATNEISEAGNTEIATKCLMPKDVSKL